MTNSQLIRNSYCSFVNLDHRIDRNEKMIESLAKAGITEYTRTRGMLPTEWPDKAQQMTAMLRRPQVGAIGCYLSQEKIIKKALELNKHAFVCEDDIVICEDFQKRIKYIDSWINRNIEYKGFSSLAIGDKIVKNGKIELIIEFLHEDYLIQNEVDSLLGNFGCDLIRERIWDCLWMGGTFHIGYKERGPYWHPELGFDAELTDDPRMIRTYGSFSTFGYIINKNSIERVLSLLDEFLPKSIGIDHSMINISPQLNTFAFVPGIFKQYDNLSDQIPSKQHITEFSGFSKLNGTEANSKYWFQDKMEDFSPEEFDWQEAQTKRWDWQK